MSEGSPFEKDDKPKGKPEVPNRVEAIDESLQADEPTFQGALDSDSAPAETHIPVQRDEKTKPETLKEVPPAFADLGSLRGLFTNDSSGSVVESSKQVTIKKEKKPQKLAVVPEEKKPKQQTPPTTNTLSFDGVRAFPRKPGTGYDREQKELGREVGEKLDIELERAALERLKAQVGEENWQHYRFTGELTNDGFLVEKPRHDAKGNVIKDERGNPIIPKPHVRPSNLIRVQGSPRSTEAPSPAHEAVSSVENPSATEHETDTNNTQERAPSSQAVVETEVPQIETPEKTTDTDGVEDVTDHIHTEDRKKDALFENQGGAVLAELEEPKTDIDETNEPEVTEAHKEQPPQSTEAAFVKLSTKKEIDETVTQAAPLSGDKNQPPQAPLHKESHDLKLEEDSVVFEGDKENPESWKVVEPHQKVIKKGGVEDVYSRKPYVDIDDPGFVAEQAEAEEQSQVKEVVIGDISTDVPRDINEYWGTHDMRTGKKLSEEILAEKGRIAGPAFIEKNKHRILKLEKLGPDFYSSEKLQEMSKALNAAEYHLQAGNYSRAWELLMVAQWRWGEALTRQPHEYPKIGENIVKIDGETPTNSVEKSMEENTEALYADWMQHARTIHDIVGGISRFGAVTGSGGHVYPPEELISIITNLTGPEDKNIERVTRTFGLREAVRKALENSHEPPKEDSEAELATDTNPTPKEDEAEGDTKNTEDYSEKESASTKEGGKELPPEFAEAKKRYIEFRNELRNAEKDLSEAITEYQLAQKESGWGRFLNKKELQRRIDEKRDVYDVLVNKFLSERESLISAHIATRKEGTTVSTNEERKYLAFLTSLTARRVERGADIISRVARKTNEHSEATNRYTRMLQQAWRTYMKLKPYQRAAVTAGLVGLGGLLVATGGALMAGASVVTAAGAGAGVGGTLFTRRFAGGAAGAYTGLFTKRTVDTLAEKREQKKLTESAGGVMSGTMLSEAVTAHGETKKQTRNIKRLGTVGAVASGVAVGASTTDMVAQVQEQAAEQMAQGVALSDVKVSNIDATRGLRNLGGSVRNAGKSMKMWFEKGVNGLDSASPVLGGMDKTAPLAHVEGPSSEPSPTPPITHVVESGDNVWNILQEKLKARGLFEGMNERQRTHFIDDLKDEISALDPEELKGIGIKSGNPDLIHPGETIDLSGVLNEKVIHNALMGVPGISDATLDSVPGASGGASTVAEVTQTAASVEQTASESIHASESEIANISENQPLTDSQTPLASENHPRSGAASSAPESVGDAATGTDLVQNEHEATSPDNSLRASDFKGGRSLEQLAQDGPDYHGEKTLPQFESLWKELQGQGKIDRHLLGRYPHLKSGWGQLSHVPVKDLYDNVQGVQFNIDGHAVDLSPQAEQELRAFIELTRHMPTPGGDGGNILEIGVAKNWSVGQYIDAVGRTSGIYSPEPVATLAALDQAQHVQTTPPEQPSKSAPVVAEQSSKTTKAPEKYRPERTRIGARYTKHVEYDPKVIVESPEGKVKVGVGARVQLGPKVPIQEIPVDTDLYVHEDIPQDYEKFLHKRGWHLFIKEAPNAEKWENLTAEELLNTDRLYRLAWQHWEGKIKADSPGILPKDLHSTSEYKLHQLKGHQALMELMDTHKQIMMDKTYNVGVVVEQDVAHGGKRAYPYVTKPNPVIRKVPL